MYDSLHFRPRAEAPDRMEPVSPWLPHPDPEHEAHPSVTVRRVRIERRGEPGAARGAGSLRRERIS